MKENNLKDRAVVYIEDTFDLKTFIDILLKNYIEYEDIDVKLSSISSCKNKAIWKVSFSIENLKEVEK